MQNPKFFWGGGTARSPDLSPSGRTPPSHAHPLRRSNAVPTVPTVPFLIASILFSVILGPDYQFSLYFFLYIPDLGFRRSRETAYQLYTRGSVIDEA